MKDGIVAAECSIMSRSRLLLRVCVGHTTSLTISISSKYHFPPHLFFIIDKGTLNGHFFSCTSLPPLLSAFLLKDTSTPIEIWWRHPDAFYSTPAAYNSPTPLSLISSLLSSGVCVRFCRTSICTNGLLARLMRCLVQPGHFPQLCGSVAPHFHLCWLTGCNLLVLQHTLLALSPHFWSILTLFFFSKSKRAAALTFTVWCSPNCLIRLIRFFFPDWSN